MGLPKRLTEKQKKFAELVVYNEGRKTGRDCALEAGYAEKSAMVEASRLQNPKRFPLVAMYIGELQCEIAGLKTKVHDAQLETSLVKAVGMNSPEMKAAKKEIEELKETLKSRDYTRQHDYQFLIDENRRFEQELNETKTDNKKLSHQINDKNSYLKELREKGVI